MPMLFRAWLLLIGLCAGLQAWGQAPAEAPLPGLLADLPRELVVHHFPSPTYASEDPDQTTYRYFWKHITTVLSPGEAIAVTGCGAYIFYDGRWNLRVRHTPKEFARLFHCRKARLKAGQPYTFPDNWRTDNRLTGGWALWYVIGQTEDGRTVCGYAALETVGEWITHQKPHRDD